MSQSEGKATGPREKGTGAKVGALRDESNCGYKPNQQGARSSGGEQQMVPSEVGGDHGDHGDH